MIPIEVKVFVAQFIMIWFLGLQSINVNRGHKLIAAITSLCLGIAGFHVTGIVAEAYKDGMMNTVFLSFILAGPCGIVSSMICHPYIVRVFKKGKG